MVSGGPGGGPLARVRNGAVVRRQGFPPRLSWWAAAILAGIGGKCLDLASPDLSWWPLAFLGVFLIVAAVWQQRAAVASLAGLLAGALFWGPHINWLTLYLGPIPWLGLTSVMTAWYVLFGVAAALATRGLARIGGLRARPVLLIAAQALTVAGLWIAREEAQGSWPYGGFAWGRIVHTQADGPLLQAVSWLGFAGLGGLIVLACAIPVAAIAATAVPDPFASAPDQPRDRSRIRRLLPALGVGAAMLALLAIVPAAGLPQTGSITVAAVQGNSKSGIFDDRENGSVLKDHLDATSQLLDRLEASGESVDVIVWPENSAEFDLRDNVMGGLRVEDLARRADAPIVVGSVLRDPDGTYTNSALVWTGEGEAPVRYDKRFPVPFAEYMPNRPFFHAIVPDLVDLVQLEYRHGTRPPVFDVPAANGAIRAGLAICFDIIFDDQAVRTVEDGAQVIFAQTNNADFGRTDENVQQLAIARLRGVETGRALVNISTVGTSAIVAPDGHDIDRIEPFAAGSVVGTVPLVEGATPALALGAWFAGAWLAIGAIGLFAGVAGSALARRRGGAPAEAGTPPRVEEID
nr:apolipoprotein N-acyltransferase [Leucobacter edaphi]